MADPLSVAASVVGIVGAAAKISTGLAGIIKKARNAPAECQRLQHEVQDISAILGQLQQFLLGTRTASRSRTSLILVDQVITTLAACVTTFSELDTFTEALQVDSDLDLLDRLRWVAKDGDLKAILVRIESHKSSLNMMLTILTCQKQEEAEDKVDRLCEMVQEVLQTNTLLAQRLTASGAPPPVEESDCTSIKNTTIQVPDKSLEIEQSDCTAIETATVQLADTSLETEQDEPEIAPVARVGTWKNSRGFAFEELLMNSRAYRSISLDNSDAFSVFSSAGRTGSWSMLSGLSLSETSHIGILAIPIYVTDIANKEAYDFDPPTTDASVLLSDAGADQSPPGKVSRRQWLKGLVLGDRSLRIKSQSGLDLTTSTPDTSAPETAVFGIPIGRSTWYACTRITQDGKTYGYIPILVAEVGHFLKEQGMLAEEIFALNGNPIRVRHLETAFNTPPRFGRMFSWEGYTVHDAAALLLRYLKTLPEPIIPYDFYQSFVTIETTDGEDGATAVEVVKKLLTSLPPLNRHLLTYLLDILNVFGSRSHTNKMTVERLTAAFQPALLSDRPNKMDADAHSTAARIVTFMTNNYGDWVD